MTLSRRHFLQSAAATAALPRLASAQAYPARPVRIICGFAPGGAADGSARIIGQWLSERLGQQLIIENRTGAAGNIATDAVVRSPADGYTLLLIVPAHAINVTLDSKLQHVFLRDIDLVAGIIRVPNVFEVNPEVPATTTRAFIERWPDRVLFGTDSAPDPAFYAVHYRFLETRDESFPYDADPHAAPTQGRWRIHGLGLDEPLLRAVYHANAARLIRF